jgi:hypothetical protein
VLNKKVIAGNILNLTDARYFAAQGVDYLLFDMANIDINTVVNIKEWVSGPEILLLFNEKAIGKLDEAIVRIEPKAIGSYSEDQKLIDHLGAYVDIFQIDESTKNEIQLYIEDQFYTTDVGKGMGTDLANLILMGGEEDKIGMKTYDELDEIFEDLQS